jgi:hypothetical protein
MSLNGTEFLGTKFEEFLWSYCIQPEKTTIKKRLQHIEGYDLLCYKDNKQDPHFSIIKILNQRVLSWYHEYLLFPGQTRTEKMNRKMLNIDCLCSTCQEYKITKK